MSIESLTAQIIANNKAISPVRAQQLAAILAGNGVSDLSQVSAKVGKEQITQLPAVDISDGVTSPAQEQRWNPVDFLVNGQRVNYLGNYGNSGAWEPGSVDAARKQSLMSGREDIKVGWSAEGDGNADFRYNPKTGKFSVVEQKTGWNKYKDVLKPIAFVAGGGMLANAAAGALGGVPGAGSAATGGSGLTVGGPQLGGAGVAGGSGLTAGTGSGLSGGLLGGVSGGTGLTTGAAGGGVLGGTGVLGSNAGIIGAGIGSSIPAQAIPGLADGLLGSISAPASGPPPGASGPGGVPAGGAASGGGLLSGLADKVADWAKNPLLNALLIGAGAYAGSKEQDAPKSTITRQMDPRLDPYVFGSGGLLPSAQNWFNENKTPNAAMRQGWQAQMDIFNNPQIRSSLMGYMNQTPVQVAGNPLLNGKNWRA